MMGRGGIEALVAILLTSCV